MERRVVHSGDLRAFHEGERYALFLFAVLPGNHTAGCLVDYLRAATGSAPNVFAVESAVRALVEAGVFADGVGARGTLGRVYRLAAVFSQKALALLASEAERKGWWPTPRILLGGLAGAWLGAELASGVRNYVSSMHVWHVCETMRALLVGGERAVWGLPPGADYPLSSAYATAVARVFDLLADGEAFEPAGLPPKSGDRLAGMLLEQAFLSGRDVRPLLTAVRAVVAVPQARPPALLLCAYCALCVWTGRKDLLAAGAAAVPRGSPAETFAELCADVFAGRFAEAERAFAAGCDGFRGMLPEDVSTPVWALGVALALREGAPLAGVARYANVLKAEPGNLLSWHPAGRHAVHAAVASRAALVERILCAGSADYRPRAEAGDGGALDMARRAFAAGYPTLAALHVAEASRVCADAPHLDEFAVGLGKAGAVPLVKAVAREPEWKTVLRALGDCLPARGGAAKAEQAVNGTIGWLLAFSPAACGDESLFSCARLVPVYRGPRGREDGRDDRRLTLNALGSDKYRGCLTACDTEVLQTLLRAGYNARALHPVPEEALERLCGHPRLSTCGVGEMFEDGVPHAPATLVRRSCELTTERGAAGEMRLKMPKWMFVCALPVVVRRVEDGAYQLLPLPKRVRDVVEVFRAHGADGVLTLPKEAVGEAKDVLMRLAGVMSVGGAFAVGENGFARTAGDPAPHVRLVYANDALSLALVVEPLPNRAVAACEPGEGLAERLVQLRGGRTVLLARDLAEEERRAACVRAALGAFDAWATGRNRWLVGSAEAALDALRALRGLEGVCLDWPEGDRVRVSAPARGGVKIEASGTDWFALDGRVAFDDGRVVALMDLLRALADREGNYVRFGEHDYVYLSGELMRRMEALATVLTTHEDEDGKTVRDRIPSAALPMLEKAFAGGDEDLPCLPETLARRAEELRGVRERPVELPRQFRGTLRAYQETGYVWLERLAECGFGSCLADDMGLGKTVQIVALLLRRAAKGVSLVVAPASVCMNWVRECERFAPGLRVLTPWDEKALPPGLGAGDVVVASYGLLVARADDFASVDWNGVVLDEAQNVKNAATQRAQVARRLRARFRVAATGTPVENRLAEFWSIFAFLNPGLLGTQREFETRFTEAGFATKALKRIVEPFVLRRLKRDVLRDLPEKTEVTLRVKLGEEERAAYEACRREALAGLRERGETGNRISVLAALTRLRRFCCHPSLVLPEMSASAKLDAVLELLGDLREGGHRALVFSQFVDYLQIVRGAVEAKGWTFRYLDGTTSQADRAVAVDAFQRGDGDFFLISLKAGGVGLNLTAANYVLLLDPWWNPAVEDQAADRAHRIGQRLPVTVYRVVAEGTVEDRILDLHGDKRAVSEDLLESAKGCPLTPEGLLSLFE